MTNSVRVRPANLLAILAVGEELRLLLHDEQPPLIKDRRYHLKLYPQCFVGSELVDWLLSKGEVNSRIEAVAMMQKLCENGVIHHVCDDHVFKDERLFFRFRKDDGTYEEPPNTALLARGEQIYKRLCGETPPLIQDRKYHLTTYKTCFVGSQLVDWLVQKGEASGREEAVQLGRELLDAGMLAHVCYDHHFKDDYLFYRFKCDEKDKSNGFLNRLSLKSTSTKRKGSTPASSPEVGEKFLYSIGDTSATSPTIERAMTARASEPVLATSRTDPAIKAAQIVPDPLSPAPSGRMASATSSLVVQRPTPEKLCEAEGDYIKRRIDIASDPVGYGFVIRGSNPVYVHSVDRSGPAAAVGLTVDEYLYSVNGKCVLNSSHTEAAKIILTGPSMASLVTFVRKDRIPSPSPVLL